MPISTLDKLSGVSAVIEKLGVAESSAGRLKSLGIFEGQTIEIAREGNPLIVKAAGSRVAIAQALAKDIFVRAVATER